MSSNPHLATSSGIEQKTSIFERVVTQPSTRSINNQIPMTTLPRTNTITQTFSSNNNILMNPFSSNDKVINNIQNTSPILISESTNLFNS